MVFSSLVFLCVFLPVVLIVYACAPSRYRNLVALAASLFFYAWGAPRFVFVLVASAWFDFVISRRMRESCNARTARLWLACGIVLNLSVLLYCKYMNFFVGQFNGLLEHIGAEPISWTRVALPIGISFFTFQKLSYLVDVYRGTVEPARSLRVYLLYVCLFPQLIAGPIVRYHDVADQLLSRKCTEDKMFSGIGRFCLGLGKKVLIANALGEIADATFNAPVAIVSASAAWLGALCYSFQIYFDFSGYSDMAIGLGRMLGFDFLENFNAPYISRSFTEFWRRWHISLSNWMKEYLYIPLGGNRRGKGRSLLNLWIVFFLSGLWHGASWTFVIWGCYHGLFLTIDKLAGLRRRRLLPDFIAVPLTFLFVTLGWVLFRSPDLSHAAPYFGRMFGLSSDSVRITCASLVDRQSAAVLLAAILFSFGPLLRERCGATLLPSASGLRGLMLRFAVSCALLFLSVMALANGSFNPFIYFRF